MTFASHLGRSFLDVAEYHPWRELRARPHIALHFRFLPEATGGALYARRGEQAVIVLDPRLSQRQRRCALAHELEHDSLGSLRCEAMPALWADVVAREEARINRQVADKLVPPDELAALAERVSGLDLALTPLDIADEFDVTHEVAQRALERLLQRRNEREAG